MELQLTMPLVGAQDNGDSQQGDSAFQTQSDSGSDSGQTDTTLGDSNTPGTSSSTGDSGTGGLTFAPTTANQWIAAFIAIVVCYLLGRLARRGIRRLASRTKATNSATQIISQMVFSIFMLVGAYASLTILGINLAPLLAGAGVASVILGFALKDVAENYVSGVLIGFSNPFVPGDRIVVAEAQLDGFVEELQLRYTIIRTGDGVRVLVPNSIMIKSPLENLTVHEHRRSEFSIGVAFETDVEQAMELAVGTLKGVEGVIDSKGFDAFVESLEASWISIRIRFWHGSSRHDEHYTKSRAIIAVVNAFNEAKIEMPLRQRSLMVEQRGGGES